MSFYNPVSAVWKISLKKRNSGYAEPPVFYCQKEKPCGRLFLEPVYPYSLRMGKQRKV